MNNLVNGFSGASLGWFTLVQMPEMIMGHAITSLSRLGLAFFLFVFPVSMLRADYAEIVREDKPVGYWRFDDTDLASGKVPNSAASTTTSGYAPHLDGVMVGSVTMDEAGPRPGLFPEFSPKNVAAGFSGKNGYVRVRPPGGNAALKLEKGDSITLEAWVQPRQIKDGQQIYIVGKGRTQGKGMAQHNQNYALRLRGMDGTARVSFLFRDERNRANAGDEDWHRWTSSSGIATGGGWHHVAITYVFGKGDSIKGYIDGVEIAGKWDMGGKTDLGPVVDEDELWIGSSMGGAAASTFNGAIDEVAIYRKVLNSEQVRKRFHVVHPEVRIADLPEGKVRVEILESVPDQTSWNFVPPAPTETFEENVFGFSAMPTKYNARGVKMDWGAPFVYRASAKVTLPAGEHRLLLRARAGARLKMDGEIIATTRFPDLNGDGHEEVPEVPKDAAPDIRYLRPGHFETVVAVLSDGKPHVFAMEAFIGPKQRRPELGELCVAVAGKEGETFYLLSPKPKVKIPLTEEGWEQYAAGRSAFWKAADVRRRHAASAEETKYWQMRHELARKHVGSLPEPSVPTVSREMPVQNEIDRFLGAKMESAKVRPAELTDDYAFLRRATLDLLGTVPTLEQISALRKDRSADRRAKAVDRLLLNPRWADNWVGYWQDVLAENPGILKPMLNNTGPFRWWIHEAFLDNKPMDRMATELVMMEGSIYYGGPAGFSLASENDVPMAQKAQIVAQAFLGMQMQCARCHDAPYHQFKQKDLFSLAAMLRKAPQEVPLSSSIPTNANIVLGRVVNVTLAPGSKVEPVWPLGQVMRDDVPEQVLRNPKDTRERLAALITDPRNERFAQVIVNRLWKRYMGWGIVEPVDDWETARPSHPELLAWLGRELVSHNYDLKHVTRLILNSHAYQRVVRADACEEAKPEARYFAAQARRRLEAEQVVDAMFAAVGKRFESEEMNLDVDARRPVRDFNNLGTPTRGWEFTSLSNERDRPALAMPKAQAIIDTLCTFGWRESRQSPQTLRDHAPNVLQPASLANGQMNNGRIARLSDDSAITRLALENTALPELVEKVFLRILGRPPTDEEANLFTNFLAPEYAVRKTEPSAGSAYKKRAVGRAVSWANHLNPEATRIKQELEREARLGDTPTERLKPEWRERMEDMVWTLVNTPEFIFVP